MKVVYVVNYSQISKPNLMRSVQAFLKYTGLNVERIQSAVHQQGGSALSVYKQEELEQVKQGAIYLFRIGKLSETEFVSTMNKAFNINLDFNRFKECWNAMCEIQADTIENLRQLETLQKKHGFAIHVIGATNSFHVNYINEQLSAAEIKLEYTHTFSSEVGKLELDIPTVQDEQWKDDTIVDMRDKMDLLQEINSLYQENTQRKAKQLK